MNPSALTNPQHYLIPESSVLHSSATESFNGFAVNGLGNRSWCLIRRAIAFLNSVGELLETPSSSVTQLMRVLH